MDSLFRHLFSSRVFKRETDAGNSSDECTKQQSRVTGILWAGFKQGAVYAGHLPNGSGCFSYQIEGQRLLAMADLMEVVQSVKPDVFKTLETKGELNQETALTVLQD